MDAQALYTSVKPDVEAVADPLFEFSEQCLKKRGNFLPHGAVLGADRKVVLVAAAPNGLDGQSISTEVLPLLHEDLRERVHALRAIALGIAENVTVTAESKPPTKAIKVLLEHENGLTVALYLPFEKRLLRPCTFGEMFVRSAAPEVNAWSDRAKLVALRAHRATHVTAEAGRLHSNESHSV